jgi:hypothetical protein
MPQLFTTKADLPIASFVGRILYPFGVSFLLPIFVITLVKEKEDRILVMMKMVTCVVCQRLPATLNRAGSS